MSGAQTFHGRALALLVLLAAGLLLWFGAASPYLDALSRSEQKLAAAKAQVLLYRRATERDSAAAADAGNASALDPLLLTGASPAAAAAYLQQRVGTVASESGAILLSFELLPPVTAGDAPLQVVAGRMRVTANTQSLRALLHALESHRPLLLLDNIFVRARSDQDTVPGGHLDAQLDVLGYRQAPP